MRGLGSFIRRHIGRGQQERRKREQDGEGGSRGTSAVTNRPGHQQRHHIPQATADLSDITGHSQSGEGGQQGRAVSRHSGTGGVELDPELQLALHRNMQLLMRMFALDTYIRLLPPSIAQNLSRTVGMFVRIFSQFFNPRGIQDVQSSIGLRQKNKRNVRRR